MTYSGVDFYCDVALKGEIPLQKEYESEYVLAYHHTKPHWPVHIVVVPSLIYRSNSRGQTDCQRAFRSRANYR